MSYMTAIPNYYYTANNQMGLFSNPYISNQNSINTKNVLNYLQSALRISLNNYQQNYQQTPTPPQSQPISQKLQKITLKINLNSLELIQSLEGKKEIINFNNLTNEKKVTEKTETPQDRQIKREPQSLTDDEFLLQDREKSQKKNQIAKRKGKKVKEDGINEFIVTIPEVDNIQAAYLPTTTFGFAELCKKRQELLKRQVTGCCDLIKNKKDKRQIRMLNN